MEFDDTEAMSAGIFSQINVAPLVDISLCTLTIFMIAAPILQQGVELELPRESIAAIEGEEEQLVISIDKDGAVFLGEGNRVELADLTERVKGIMAARREDRVFIRADRRVPYGGVMAVMGRLRRSGIVKVGLVTEPSSND